MSDKKIIMMCPLCKKDIEVSQEVFYHPGDNVFYHTKCLEKLENEKQTGSGSGTEST